MIRLIQRRLIIPRGDTGSFSLPVLANKNTGDIAVFTIFDSLTKTRAFQKIIEIEGDVLTIAFSHNETVNLKPGKYFWDIKFYSNPQIVDDELVNGDEVDSYYAGFTMPACEIRETADNYLVSPDSPTATLSPEQLDIITGAINELNEAIRKANENVEHYPEIRDEVWYVWDTELGDFVSTGVRANGIVGNGIASAILNDDYTLTLNFTDGTSYTSPSIRGNGIEDIVLNNDYTLTIIDTDGAAYTTPSIRGPVGATPNLTIGTVQEGPDAAATITGTSENPVLNLTLPNANVPTNVSELQNDANYAVDANYVHTDNNYTTAEKNKLSGIAAGAEVNINADWNAISGDAQILNKPTKVSDFTNDAGYLTTETDPTVPAWAKAAQKPSYTAAEVGAPTIAEMNTAIGIAIGQINSFDMAVVQALPMQDISTHTIYLVPKTGETNDVYDEYVYINDNWEMVGNTQIDLSNYATKDELPDVPVQDVQVNGISILGQGGTANIQKASNDNLGVVGIEPQSGVIIQSNGKLEINPASTADIKKGENTNKPIVVFKQDAAAFYGLATAAGDITQSTSSNAVGTYTDDAKTAIQQMLDVPSTDDIPEVPVQDVQVNGTSILDAQGVANVPVATDSVNGVVKVDANFGVYLSYGKLRLNASTSADVKAGTSILKPVMPSVQHASTFYGLAKAAGYDEKDSTEPVGTYTPEAKGAIQQMLGVSDLIAPAENGLVASKAYAVGDIFTANGKLYKATAAIAANAAIITDGANANCEETSVEDGFPHDVQINGTSIISNGVANIPIAAANTPGVVEVNGNGGITFLSEIVDGRPVTTSKIGIMPAQNGEIKNMSGQFSPITANKLDRAVFYGLAAAAKDSTQSSSSNTVGTYTDEAKTAIQQMLNVPSADDIPDVPVQDVQINGTSILADDIANIPLASTNTIGVVKVGSGLQVGSNNELKTNVATSTNIKVGTEVSKPIVPALQHVSTFYGLAKAAGDTTQFQSDNTVGTYTDEAKSAINNMIGSVNKESIENAGITSKTYSEKFGGEFTVTTTTTSGWLNPYARASVTGRISKHYMHKVTFNGTEYILRTRLWYNTNDGLKVYEYLGNLGLYIENITGVPGGTDNVPFIIISDLNNNSSIDVITQTAGTYTILVEQINPTKVDLPKSLIWEDSYVPIEKNNNGGTYNGFSFGVNELNNQRGTFAFGYGNKIENEFTNIIGTGNNASKANSLIYGKNNTVTEAGGIAIGLKNSVSGNSAIAIGYGNTANGSDMIAIGKFNAPAITNFPMWQNNTQYKKGDIFQAYPMPNVSVNFLCLGDYLSTSSGSFMDDFQTTQNIVLAPSSGDTLFVIGNGTSSSRSNALKIDVAGNEYIGGNLYINCDSDSTNGTKVATVNDILVNDVQVNGTSVLDAQGVANVPVASSNNYGVVKLGSGLRVQDNTKIAVTFAASSSCKEGTNNGQCITPNVQNAAAFYGLAKAAGDTTQSTSNNAVGTYTDAAKSAIQSMLGVSSMLAPENPNLIASQTYAIGDVFAANGKLYKATAAIAQDEAIIPDTNCTETNLVEENIKDIQVEGTSVLENGVANITFATPSKSGVLRRADNTNMKAGNNTYFAITSWGQHTSVFYGLSKVAGVDLANETVTLGTYPETSKTAIRAMLGAIGTNDYASTTDYGLVKIGSGLTLNSDGKLVINSAGTATVKQGTNVSQPITPGLQHTSTFYGLAKAAGDITQSASNNAVGTYTDSAKASIKQMFGIVDGSTGVVEVNGTTPTVAAVENTRYVCGEVTSLNFTPAVNGTCIIRFTSGSSVTVLTIPSTVKFPEWFDPTNLETNTIYEICVTDGIYGAVMSWAL